MSAHAHGPANRGRRVLDAAAPLFVCEPGGRPVGGALVLHDVFGVTEHAEEACRALARRGRLAVSPYLYHEHGGPAFAAEELAAARTQMEELTPTDLAADVGAALGYLESRRTGPVLVVGFSMGGHLATWAAAHHVVEAAVAVSPSAGPWPGVPSVEALVAGRRSPWLGVVGGADGRVDADRLRAAAGRPGPPAAVEVVDGAGHGFYRKDALQRDGGLWPLIRDFMAGHRPPG
ncbi:dienelactone hydrolase family protein [Streptosporangium sp. NPDC051023]|uniref:dienelactone hydrolase family protein n=1 Tax=Streptosporangium sp. NPDC051023 TaxID=3155410 RepID=UPI00344CFA61